VVSRGSDKSQTKDNSDFLSSVFHDSGSPSPTWSSPLLAPATTGNPPSIQSCCNHNGTIAPLYLDRCILSWPSDQVEWRLGKGAATTELVTFLLASRMKKAAPDADSRDCQGGRILRVTNCTPWPAPEQSMSASSLLPLKILKSFQCFPKANQYLVCNDQFWVVGALTMVKNRRFPRWHWMGVAILPTLVVKIHHRKLLFFRKHHPFYTTGTQHCSIFTAVLHRSLLLDFLNQRGTILSYTPVHTVALHRPAESVSSPKGSFSFEAADHDLVVNLPQAALRRTSLASPCHLRTHLSQMGHFNQTW
jgi:hypothetical protein